MDEGYIKFNGRKIMMMYVHREAGNILNNKL
jgi:hypothetical protein